MYFLLAFIVFACLLAAFVLLISPDRTVSWRAIGEAAAVAAVCWATAFVAPLVTEVSGRTVDALMAVAALSVFVSGVAFAARKMSTPWAAYFGGFVFAAAIWAVSLGIYTEYAAGWQGLRLEDIGSGDSGVDSLWLGAFFFAPTSAIPGVLVGLIASIARRRARAAAAAAA